MTQSPVPVLNPTCVLLEAWIFLLTIVCTPGASTHGETYEVQTYITSNKKG